MANKTKQTGRTSVAHAWPPYVIGLIMLTWGILAGLSLWTSNSGVLHSIRRAATGLFGAYAPLGVILILFASVKIIAGLYHRVTQRDWALLSVLFILLLTFVTLITRLRESNGNLMTYIRLTYYPIKNGNYQAGYADYLAYAFENGSGAVGMLLAYPLWNYLGHSFSVLLTVLGILGVLAALCITPIRRAIAALQAREHKRPRREYVAEEPADWRPDEPIRQPAAVQPQADDTSYMPPAPRFDEPIYGDYPPARKNEYDTEFVEVSGESMYSESFQPGGKPQAQPAGVPMTDVDSLRYQVTTPPVQPSQRRAPAAPKAAEKPVDAPAKQPNRTSKDKTPAAPERELIPDIPIQSPVEPAAPVKPAGGSGRPADAQITEQVLKGAKPVNTDSAVVLTNERIPITPRAEAPGQGERKAAIDGTSQKPAVLKSTPKSNVRYTPPPVSLLAEPHDADTADWGEEDQRRAQIIEKTLESFNIPCQVKQILHGPAITRFAIQIAQGIRVNRVTGIATDLGLALAASQVRVEAPIPGTNFIGIEVPNKVVSTVLLREVLDSLEMRAFTTPLAVCLGKNIAGTPVICDLSKMPHLLIAGATGSGKSVCIHSIVCSLTYRSTPEQVRLIMIDPKQVELSVYNALPHLLIPVVTDVRKAAGALAWAVQEMQDRYHRFSENGVRNLEGYNRQNPDEKLPNIVIVIDEMADLMDVCRKEVEEYIRRLAALARAAGIYMVLATQRPSVDVITGVIKNNIPSRIAFAVSSGTDSRTILDQQGAEKLLGKGDMLYKPMGLSPARVQGCFVSDEDVNGLMGYISRYFKADYDEGLEQQLQNAANNSKSGGGLPVLSGDLEEDGADTDASQDEMLPEAIQMALEDGQTSTSMLQRRLRIGYARAGRLIDEMEKLGIISAQDGSKPRKTIMTREQYNELISRQG